MQENINIPDSTITTNLSFRQLVLMNMQQLTNFPYIEKDFDALTDYELLCLVVKFLNDVIANQNEQNDSITRMYQSFLSLQDYVNNTKDTLEDAFNTLDNYVRTFFDNLDLQEEVDNKLDKMIEDGTLQEIIASYLQSNVTWTFDTVADMKSATNLINGSFARTIGYYSINDGGGAFYKIVEDEPLTHYEELDNNLYAKLIIDEKTNVDQYGAKGDGTTDDSSIIQTAINELDIVNFNEKTYLVSNTLTPKNNLELIGDKTKFKINNGDEVIKYNPNAESKRIYSYTVTGNESSNSLFIEVSGEYYNLTLSTLVEDDKLYINPSNMIAVRVSADLFSEEEYELINSDTGADITSQCTITNVNMPSTYLTNFKVEDIAFEYDSQLSSKYAIYIKYGKNITINKCSTKNAGLIWVGLSENSSPEVGSTTTDVYVKNGYSTAILNDGITVNNCYIYGTKAKYSDLTYQSSGIYLQYCKNCRVENNEIYYLKHGISVWGGNVGGGNFQQSEMIPLCNNLTFINNKVDTMLMGGIWTSRSSSVIANSNNINICGDVGIDFEGSFNCVADGNVVNNCHAGCLATLYGSCEIVFSNNTCIDKGLVNCTQMVICNNSGFDRYTRVIYDGNIFKSYYKMLRGVHLLSCPNGYVSIVNNMFCNTYIDKTTNIVNPYVEIYNNTFTCTPDCDITGFDAFIKLKGENRLNTEVAVIKNNVFDVSATHATAYSRLKNNSKFDGKYAIQFTDGTYGYKPTLTIDNNEIYGFNKSIFLNHIAPSGDLAGTLTIYMKNNLISGPVYNTSDERGYFITENNKSIYNGDNQEFKTAFNYPNAIPTDSTHGGWFIGTRIDFDTPVDGYTSAICTATGQPGTWKKFGLIEE